MKAFSESPAKNGVKSICLQRGCTKCCQDTEMPLSDLDISRIEKLGFRNFSAVKRNGHRCLRNSSGRCVFHDGQQCTIYSHRPEGCQLYPVIFNEDIGEAVLDSYCPHNEKFQLTPKIAREVTKLVRKLDVEKVEGACDLRNGRNLGIRES